ncbi:MAG: lysine--tRNA ligase [Acidobacteria bacterium]|nr:lysine--tRNA ligase [Acidobacteriota bacterium]MBI3425973.1 lysine--tRNA ligase [Acidobacteriota bacterium]
MLEQDNDQIQQRRQHLADIAGLGHAAYPHRFDRTHTISQAAEGYQSFAGKKEGAELEQVNAELKAVTDGAVRLAGRIMTQRLMGKAAFANLTDGLKQLQVYLRKNDIGDEAWALYQKLDLGDWVGVEGFLFITKTGELSLHVHKLEFLAKALLPMPDKYHGVQDKELRYRQRYVDLIASSSAAHLHEEATALTSREVFERRAQIIREVRHYFDSRGYVEVETPMLTPLATGAAARPFKTHHNALDIELFARIAPELYLKRLIVGGFERVYEINRNFRNEGLSYKHNPEFTMLEWYQAYSDYRDLMDLTEELLTLLADRVCGTRQVPYQGQTINFDNWQRLTMREAVLKYWPDDKADAQPSLDGLLERGALEQAAAAAEMNFDPKLNDGQLLGALFERVAEPHLLDPTFIIEYPTELSPLSKQNQTDPRFVDRFELFIASMEVANGFSELNDPIEQRRRFEEQMQQRAGGDDEAMVMDEDYIRALSYGMPPTAGEGIGIDRVVMLLTNQHSIRDVILFPHMRPESK